MSFLLVESGCGLRGNWRWELAVGIIVVRCPKTNQEISTGIEIEPEDFLLLPPVAGRVQCPLCGEEHSWLPSTARVKDVELRVIGQAKPSDPSAADAT
jgi:hypothetical protein